MSKETFRMNSTSIKNQSASFRNASATSKRDSNSEASLSLGKRAETRKQSVLQELLATDDMRRVVNTVVQDNAEVAKARATATAKLQEERAAKELEVTRMWRHAVGSQRIPGLKAELAKMRATEQAKMAEHRYEEGRKSCLSQARPQSPP